MADASRQRRSFGGSLHRLPRSAAELGWPAASIAPALPAHFLANGAGNPRRSRLGGNDARLRRAPGDLQHQLGADRVLELRPLPDRDDERAWSANHAVLVIDVEVLDIERGRQ